MKDVFTVYKDGTKLMTSRVRNFEDEYNMIGRFLKWLGDK
jgi:hypothetical protein